ncbi:MAG: Ig-like domain-containing protein, partial [Rhodobacteraceae bacterium]|nr:Ig-like domain-containing protein [Paracoccaceae bacterium]
MNPIAMILALLTTLGAASALAGGRSGRLSDDGPGGGNDDDGSGSDGGGSGGGNGGNGDVDAPPNDLNNPIQSPAPTPIETTPDPVVLQPGVTASVMSGRVALLELPKDMDVAGLRVVTPPEHGNVTVNADGTLAVVLTDSTHTGPMKFTYEVRASDGTVKAFEANLSVSPGAQQAGWGLGDKQYMLATDANDELIVETGSNHRLVYVSGSDKALSRADIAALEGIDPSRINGAWLAANPKYGASEAMALKPDV